MTESGSLRIGIIGDPIDHSLSPALHQPALDASGIPARYARWPTTAAELAARIATLREADAIGASVTVPHKVAVMPMLDQIAETARAAGAVNTIINRNGHLLGENTDIHGVEASLREVRNDFKLAPTVLLGAGGAARAVVLALHALGVPEIIVANRNRTRAEQLATDLAGAPLTLITTDPAALHRALGQVAILINATSIGWRSGEAPFDLDLLARLSPNALVMDLTYRDTDLLVAARSRQLDVLDGLPMLVHQGARAFELWTGQPAPLAVMRQAAVAARQQPPGTSDH